MPVLAGACAAGVVGAAVGSWEPVALVIVVLMLSAAAGRPGSGMDGMRGSAGDLAAWCCSVGWWGCCWVVGALVVPAGLELVLGDDGVPDGPLPEMRLDKVGFTGALGAVGVPGALGDSAVGVVVTRGIEGSW
ncbi:hypothetical protein [Mycobacteroides abscessus]|uniref:hypothetical protein n=1 Tax=Mycobacteroides abscessus TaxID=36809 RepID=UPI001F3D51D4|nr:hypothetical protein [Mycobacteroides abscessus]